MQKKIIYLTRVGLNWLKILFTPLAFAYLGYYILASKDVLGQIFSEAQSSYFAASILLFLVLHILSPLATTIAFRATDNNISYSQAFYIYARRLPAKYLPGGIWHTASRASDYHKIGIPLRSITIYILFEIFMVASITLLLGGLVVSQLSYLQSGWSMIAVLSVPISISTIVIFPYITKQLFFKNSLVYRLHDHLLSTVIIALQWFFVGLSFAAFLNAFSGIEFLNSTLEMAGIYIFSWGIGFIAIFAPQGLGVSEYVGTELFLSDLRVDNLVAILASYRLIVLVADLTLLTTTIPIKMRRKFVAN